MFMKNKFLSTTSVLAICYCQQLHIFLALLDRHLKNAWRATADGYIRKMCSHDIVAGSQAKEGWYGYFDADGDIVMWHTEIDRTLYYISGVPMVFRLLH